MSDACMSTAICADLLGDKKAEIFIKHFGGTSLYIPRKPIKDHDIAQAIGIIGMTVLCREYGGLYIGIAGRRDDKRILVRELIEQGLTLSKIAIQAGVSSRHVSYIKAADKRALQAALAIKET